METPSPSSASTPSPSPAEIGTKLLSKFADTDALLMRTTQSTRGGETTPSKAPAIPLQRFQELEQAIRNAPAASEPYVELGRIYLDQLRWNDAKRVLESGVQFCPDCEPLLLMREDLTLLLAARQVDEARAKHAQTPSDQSRYECEQTEINLANERIRICEKRFDRRPQEKEIIIPWAIALRQLGRVTEAAELLTKAAREPRLRARASLQLGMCYQLLERPLDALSAFRKAALYRSPPPDPAIRNRALELASLIAEQHQLIDSARFYTAQLLQSADAARQPEVQKRLRELNQKAL